MTLAFHSERQEYRVFTALCAGSPNLEDRILGGDDKEVRHIADLVRIITGFTLSWGSNTVAQIQKGSSGARSDDTKSLKGVVLDWITPKGEVLSPPLDRNVKHTRGFHHDRTGFLLCPIGEDWSNQE